MRPLCRPPRRSGLRSALTLVHVAKGVCSVVSSCGLSRKLLSCHDAVPQQREDGWLLDENADPPRALDWEKAAQFEVEVSSVGSALVVRKFSIASEDRPKTFVKDEHIYPAWVDPASKDALKDWREHWAANIEQVRTTSKWVASILGTVLALLVGTAPLTGLTGRGPVAWLLAIVSILLALVVLALTLQVLAPTVINIVDVYPTSAKVGPVGRVLRPRLVLQRLGSQLEANGGVALPIGIATIGELVGRIRLEEVTLGVLAPYITSPSETVPSLFERAQTTRGQIYDSLQQDVAEILALAQFELVQARASLARRAGFAGGTIAVALLAGALLQPLASPDFRIGSANNASTRLAQTLLGPNCVVFSAVVTGTAAPPDETAIGATPDSTAANAKTSWTNLTVRKSSTCNGTTITVPAADLVRVN